MRNGIFLLLSLAFCISILVQSVSGKSDEYECDQPLGVFRQITGANLKLSDGYYGGLFSNKESDLRENRWTLDPLDEVDPAYKFYLERNPALAGKKKCGETIELTGKLISPAGKLFGFKHAAYNISSRTLKFTTIERDGITFEVEVQFFPQPIEKNGRYHDGHAKLKASGKLLGTVTIDFPVSSANSE